MEGKVFAFLDWIWEKASESVLGFGRCPATRLSVAQ
jgi:hypothetical protein